MSGLLIFKILDQSFPPVLCLLIEEYYREYKFLEEFKAYYPTRITDYIYILHYHCHTTFKCISCDKRIFLYEDHYKPEERQISFYSQENIDGDYIAYPYGDYNLDYNTKEWKYIIYNRFID